MDSLDYLGGALENFYEGDMENPHLIARDITVKENGKRQLKLFRILIILWE